MGFIQCVGDLERHAQCLPYGQRSALQPIRQGLAFDELHHDEELVLHITELIDIDDVRVLQQTAEACLADEGLDVFALRQLQYIGLDDLDRDLLAKARWTEQLRPKHPSHPPYAEEGLHLVAPETQRQIGRSYLIEPGLSHD